MMLLNMPKTFTSFAHVPDVVVRHAKNFPKFFAHVLNVSVEHVKNFPKFLHMQLMLLLNMLKLSQVFAHVLDVVVKHAKNFPKFCTCIRCGC